MSLIQDALKRKDDEHSGIPPKTIPVIPPGARAAVKPPAISVKPPVPPVKEKTSRAWPVLVISLLVIAVLALVAAGLLLYSARSLTQGGQQAKAVKAAIEKPVSSAVVPESFVAAAPEPVRATPAPVLEPVEPVVEAAPAVEAATQAPAAVVPMMFSISTGIVKEGTTEKKPASVVPVSRPVVSPSAWPALKVLGVMASRSTAPSGAAIIDGNLVECGDEIRGVKVQGVDKSGVWFEFKSQTQFVRVGQTTL